ncbi:MAG: hypothetical protein JW712_02060 [Dehalococcoidales bacterium]|nr:hypothetical protein [Dehalococcoidales bacterium]
MNNSQTFRINLVHAIKMNIQFTVVAQRDSLVFVKTGGQFADFRYVAVLFAVVSAIAVLVTVLAVLYFHPAIAFLFMAIGMGLGGLVTDRIIKNCVKPHDYSRIETELISSSTDELLMRNKNNFVLPFSDIGKVSMQKTTLGATGPRTGTIQFNDTIYDISPGQDFDRIKSLVQTILPGKIE